jgi:hypothetical protein
MNGGDAIKVMLPPTAEARAAGHRTRRCFALEDSKEPRLVFSVRQGRAFEKGP